MIIYHHPNTNRTFPPYITENEYRGYPINSSMGGCFLPILDNGFDLLDYVTFRPSRLLFFALSLNVPKGYDFNSRGNPLPQFLDSFKKNRQLAGITPLHRLWVAEVSKNSDYHPLHWHLAYFYKGNQTQNLWYHAQEAVQLWNRQVGGGNVHYMTKKDGVELLAQVFIEGRNDPEFMQKKFEIAGWISYMAKCESKLNLLPGVKMFFPSRIPPRSLW